MSIQNSTYIPGNYHYMQQQPTLNYIKSYNPPLSNFPSDALPLSQIKSNTSNSGPHENDKSMNKMDLSLEIISTMKEKKLSSLCGSLLAGVVKGQARREGCVVWYFGTGRRIEFGRGELQVEGKDGGTVGSVIPYMVKQYCLSFLNFEPLEVKHQHFELKLANHEKEDDELIDPYDHDEDINLLFQCGSLVLTRKPKDYDRLKVWQEKIQPDMQVLQLVIPSQREIIEQVQRNKPLAYLKQKLTSSNQLGNIVIVTYNTFTVCDPKKKISDIVTIDRVLEVYQLQMQGYEDIGMATNKQKTRDSVDEPQRTQAKQNRVLIDEQFQVNETILYGKMYIKISNCKIIEKYEGGLMGYWSGGVRFREKSIHTLVGICCERNVIVLKFITKDGPEIKRYEFGSRVQVQAFFKLILRLGRELKQNFQKIDL